MFGIVLTKKYPLNKLREYINNIILFSSFIQFNAQNYVLLASSILGNKYYTKIIYTKFIVHKTLLHRVFIMYMM